MEDTNNLSKPTDGEDIADRHKLESASKVILITAASITPKPVDWLWRDFLARGKLHIVAGPPSSGKTTIVIDLGATISTGGTWPDGSTAPTGDVLIWSGEDDTADTLVPRLLACGADTSRVHIIEGIRENNGESRSFDPARDMSQLQKTAKELTIELLIVDSIVSAVATDSHKNSDVRRALQPLVDLAQTLNCAVVGITHFSKGTENRDPVDRVTGSLAFGALARVVLVAAKCSKEDDGDRILVRAKSNIGPDGDGFRYSIEQIELPDFPTIVNSRVIWGDEVNGSAQDILADNGNTNSQPTRINKNIHWLRNALENGPRNASDVTSEALIAGISRKALQTAQKRLDITRDKTGFTGGWVWSLAPKE